MAQTKDLYAILGVSRDASEDEVKKAFRQQARKYHPDNKETGNEDLFKEINHAYEILSDPEKRAIYDRYGLDGLKSTFGDLDIFDFGDLSDIFSQFFGGAARAHRPTGPERGADLRFELEIDFLEAIHGCTKKITIYPFEECGVCKGTGARPGSKLTTCRSCNGLGEVRKISESFFGHVTQITTCPSCFGTGKIVEQICTECHGKALKQVKKSIDVKVPCGVDHGARLRWGGKGNAGKKGGPPGDLYVVVNVKEHEIFVREEQNIFIEQKISFTQAALGGNIKVPTTEGEKALNIPSGIQTGTILKMPGLGVPKLNNPARRGDELVQIMIETPTKLSAEERKIFEQLAKIQEEREHKKKEFFD
ncbi:MAG: molecular chaperone DnaJ [Candidatus Melainabacteria bacterium]|nr:molecular chaperone DnaJ [Candidatus Melainabacteria bacterium]